MYVPPPATNALLVFKSPVSVQLVPFHCSVFAIAVGAGGGPPPKTKAAVLCPALPAYPLAVFKTVPVDQVPEGFDVKPFNTKSVELYQT